MLRTLQRLGLGMRVKAGGDQELGWSQKTTDPTGYSAAGSRISIRPECASEFRLMQRFGDFS